MKKFTLAMSMSLLMSSVAIANPTFTVDTDETGDARKAPTFHRSLKQTFENEFSNALNGAQVWTNETPLRAVYERAIAAHTPKKYTKLGLYEKAISENTVEGVETQGILLAAADEWDAKLAEAYTGHPVARKAITDLTTESKLLELKEEWNTKVAEVLSAPSAEWDTKLAEAYEGDEGVQAVQRLTTEGRVQLVESGSQSQWNTYLANLRDREPVSVSVVDGSTIKFEPVKAVIQRALSEVGPYDKYKREAIYLALTTDANIEPKPFMTVLSEDAFDSTTYTFKTSLPEGTKSLLLGGEGLLPGKIETALFGATPSDALRIPAVIEDLADKATVSVNTNPLANADFLVGSYTKMLKGLEEESLTQITDATLSRLYEDETFLNEAKRALAPLSVLKFSLVGGEGLIEPSLYEAGFEFVSQDGSSLTVRKQLAPDFDGLLFCALNLDVWEAGLRAGHVPRSGNYDALAEWGRDFALNSSTPEQMMRKFDVRSYDRLNRGLDKSKPVDFEGTTDDWLTTHFKKWGAKAGKPYKE